MAFEKEINAYFVNIENNNSDGRIFASNDDFENAKTLLHNHIPIENIREINASEGLALIANEQLSKKDVFILNRFCGGFFRHLQQSKALIVGPRCLMTCLLHRQAIPLGTSPVYTAAMRNLRISATGITAKEKDRVRELVQWMGGHYFADFGRCVTHLVSNTICSEKYEQAVLNGITVMHADWVQRVWERSCGDDVNATDKEFQKYMLPIFFGTNITSSGLNAERKNEISQLVNHNGGTYHSCFRSQIVDILITDKNGTNSDKYKAAVRYKKDILLPEWISDSLAKGYALPMRNYRVKSLNASTPTKSQQLADFTAVNSSHLSDISRISVLAGSHTRGLLANTVNETQCSSSSTLKQQLTASSLSRPSPVAGSAKKELQREVLKKWSSDSNYRVILDEINPKMVRNIGTFLDGCCIYLSGFRAEEREKLIRILNIGGATRYDVVNEKITHIIIGNLNEAEYKIWKNDGILAGAHIVSIHWLLESIKLKAPASEVVYHMPLPKTHQRAPETPSPSSKKTLRSMNHSFKQPDKPIKKKLFDLSNEKDDSPSTQLSNTITSADTTPVIAGACDVNAMEVDINNEDNFLAQYSQKHMTAAAVIDAMPVLPALKACSGGEEQPMCHDTSNNDNTALHAATPIASSTLCVLPKLPETTATVAAGAVYIPQNNTEMTETIDYANLNFLECCTIHVFEGHFSEEFYSQILYECEAAKGDIVSSSFCDTVDYVIVSFERTLDISELPVRGKHIVNDLYVETCLKLNKFITIEYYHKHIPHTANVQPLKGMAVVISTYAGLERDFINSIAELMGARVNKSFIKKEKPLLICPLPEGSKYQGAIKWGYPVVSSEWLLHCATEGRKLPYASYLIGDSVKDFATSPTLREHNSTTDAIRTRTTGALPSPLQQNAAKVNQNDPQKASTSNEALADFTPLRNRRVCELAGNQRANAAAHNSSGVESPHTPPNSHLVGPTYDIEVMETMLAEIEDENQRECWREIINEIRKNPTPQLERIRRQACTPMNRGKWPSPKGIPDFCTTPAYKQRMRDEFERRYRLPIKQIPPDTPIEEICRRVLYATCETHSIPVSNADVQDKQPKSKPQLRGSTASNDCNSITPTQRLNVSDNRSPAFAAPRMLFGNGEKDQQCVAPHGSDKTYVPSTQTPESSSDRSEKQSPAMMNALRASVMGKSTIDFDKINFDDSQLALINRPESSSLSSTTMPSNANVSPEVKQISDYLKSFETRRHSLKRTAALMNEQAPPQRFSRSSGAMCSETEGHFVCAFESENFVGTEEMVAWQDPGEFTSTRVVAKFVSQMQYKGTPCFSISCAHEETKLDIITKIQNLGGKVCDNLMNFDKSCTHFLCERPNRGEKTLGCISSGKWVLSLRYIEESFAKNTFVNEELFEWGNCKAINMPQLNPEEQVIATAAHRWRCQLALTHTGAFTGIRAILHISERHLNALKTVIKAGEGEIIETAPPYSCRNRAHLATHCFVDMKRNPLVLADYDFLQSRNIKVLTQMYINEYLMKSCDIDCAQYEVKL